jgi:hypothetical protein
MFGFGQSLNGRFLSCAAVCAGALAALVSGPARADDSRTFAIGWWTQATNSSDDDCANGLNPGIVQQYLLNLAPLGLPKNKIEELAKKDDGDNGEVRELMTYRGRIDGKPVNALAHPAAVADPQLRSLTGKYAFGFNLDGKPGGFEDPETHEKGVDDQLYRALGCIRSMRGSLVNHPTFWAWAWGQTLDSMPAWMVTIKGQDLTKDGDITVTFDRSLDHVRLNIDGSPKSDASYRIDSDPRSHHVYRGTLKNGVITVASGEDLRLVKNFLTDPELVLHKAHFRIHLKPDGSLDGFMGGYQPWRDLYFGFAAGGPGTEFCIIGDVPGIYYLLKKHADADPDPKTGQNTTISATYYFEAVPAFVVAGDKVASSN